MERAVAIKTTLLDLIKDMKESVFLHPEEQKEMIAVEIYFKLKDCDAIASGLVSTLLPHEKKIKKRDISYFITNDGIFEGLPKNRIQHYKDYFSLQRITEENINVIWQYLDLLLNLIKTKKNV